MALRRLNRYANLFQLHLMTECWHTQRSSSSRTMAEVSTRRTLKDCGEGPAQTRGEIGREVFTGYDVGFYLHCEHLSSGPTC